MENLFVYDGAPGHEIVWMHEAVLVDLSFYARDELAIEEDGARGRAVWKSLRDFGSGRAPLYPDGLLELLDERRRTADR